MVEYHCVNYQVVKLIYRWTTNRRASWLLNLIFSLNIRLITLSVSLIMCRMCAKDEALKIESRWRCYATLIVRKMLPFLVIMTEQKIDKSIWWIFLFRFYALFMMINFLWHSKHLCRSWLMKLILWLPWRKKWLSSSIFMKINGFSLSFLKIASRDI